MILLKSKRNQRRGLLAEINVVPYIDVMLVLLVIFMITAPLLSQGINVTLPQTSAKALPPHKDIPIVVSVDNHGQYYLNIAPHPKQPILKQELFYRVAALLRIAAQAQTPRPVYVKGDRSVDYGAVVSAMTLLQKAGAANVGLITEPNQS
jgi:biopolymer transport protein TolR